VDDDVNEHPGALLTDGQQRRVGSVMRSAEDAIVLARSLLSGADERQLRPVVVTFSPTEQQRLQAALDDLQGALRAVQARFNIEAELQDGRRMLRSRFTLLWAGLEDARSTTLRRYGPVHAALAGELDPLIESMLDGVQRILTQLGEPS
jgi:hypothetical protein